MNGYTVRINGHSRPLDLPQDTRRAKAIIGNWLIQEHLPAEHRVCGAHAGFSVRAVNPREGILVDYRFSFTCDPAGAADRQKGRAWLNNRAAAEAEHRRRLTAAVEEWAPVVHAMFAGPPPGGPTEGTA